MAFLQQTSRRACKVRYLSLLALLAGFGCGATESPTTESPTTESPTTESPTAEPASDEAAEGPESAQQTEEDVPGGIEIPEEHLEGVGPLRFGMARAEAERLAGDQRHPLYYATRIPYQPIFDDSDRLIAIDVAVSYLEQEIFVDGVRISKDNSVGQLIEAYGDCGPSNMAEGGSERLCRGGAVGVGFGSGSPDEPILRVRGRALPMARLVMRVEEGAEEHLSTVVVRLEGVGDVQETRVEAAGIPMRESFGLGGVSLYHAGEATQLYVDRVGERVVLFRSLFHEEGQQEAQELHSFDVPSRQTLQLRVEGVSSTLSMVCPEGMEVAVSCAEGPTAHRLCTGSGRFRFAWDAEKATYEGLLDRLTTYEQVSPHRTRGAVALDLDREFFIESAHDGSVNVSVGADGTATDCTELGGHRSFSRIAAPSLSYPR